MTVGIGSKNAFSLWLPLSSLLLLSVEIIGVSAAAACFQVQAKSNSFWGMAGMTLDAPDDYMQNMASEMLLLNAHYDYSYNKSPTETTTATTKTTTTTFNNKLNTQELVHAMERARLHMKAMQEQAKHDASSIVSPWIRDDIMRDTANEWDTLGTNYDYSYNNSPTGSKDNDNDPSTGKEEKSQARASLLETSTATTTTVPLQQQPTPNAQQKPATDKVMMPLVKSWTRDHWEQWMTLHQITKRGENSLAWPSTKDKEGKEGNGSVDLEVAEVSSLQLQTQTWKTNEKEKQQFQPYDENNNNENPKLWRNAVDASSGKTYYYHIHTKETQWNMPGPEEERIASAGGHVGGASYSSSYLESL